jgi:hypothetical protein
VYTPVALTLKNSASQRQCYVTTDAQPASLSLCQAPIWGPRPHFCYCQTVPGLLTWGAYSDERTDLPFTIAAGPPHRSHSRVPVPSRLMTIFYCLRFETLSTWRARSPYLYLPGTGCPSYIPRYWVPFSSPPTPHRATVEVLKPASTRDITLFHVNITVFR